MEFLAEISRFLSQAKRGTVKNSAARLGNITNCWD
jgi:hypothetical protein